MIFTSTRARLVGLAIAAAAGASLAVPAAAERSPAPAKNSVAPQTEEGGGSAATPKLYCIVDTLTGTRMPKKVCKTQSQWRDEGVDVTKSK